MEHGKQSIGMGNQLLGFEMMKKYSNHFAYYVKYDSNTEDEAFNEGGDFNYGILDYQSVLKNTEETIFTNCANAFLERIDYDKEGIFYLIVFNRDNDTCVGQVLVDYRVEIPEPNVTFELKEINK